MTTRCADPSTSTTGIDLGATLRALRRRADLSQRELAERAGVPASTVARIESGAARDPRFRTMERLVSAAGGVLTPTAGAAANAVPPHPAEKLVDEAGRHYPAHLDLRRVTDAHDWWGAWWANWYKLPRERWPRQAPEHTFDLKRSRRDERRRRERGRKAVARIRIVRQTDDVGVPPDVCRWHAIDEDGAVVGWVGGCLRTRRVDGGRELVLGDIEVASQWRRCGLGRRLLGAVRAALPELGVRQARVLMDDYALPYTFFTACGFYRQEPGPAWLVMTARA